MLKIFKDCVAEFRGYVQEWKDSPEVKDLLGNLKNPPKANNDGLIPPPWRK